MKSKLAAALLAVGSSFACLSDSIAATFQGGEITYAKLAPNTYQVNCKLFTECINAAPATAMLALNAPGCNTGRTVTLTKTGTSKLGDPYCSVIGNSCNPNGRENHEENNYTATITFSAAEAACPNWVLSVTDTARTKAENLVNPQQDLYLETPLYLSPGSQNTTAKMNPVAPTVEYVCVGQETRLSFTAYDPDCDSLSYRLVAPFRAHGVPYNYANASAGQAGQFFPNPNPPAPYCNVCPGGVSNPQFGFFSGMPLTTFTPTYPLPSYNANWNQINPATGMPFQFVPVNPFFQLDTVTGELRFRPAVYHATPAAQGDNKYAVSVQVNEWRKQNGVMVKVGDVQRDVLFIVENCLGNTNPEITYLSANGQQIHSGDIITVRPNAMLNMQFITDEYDQDTLSLDTDVTDVLPGATFSKTTAPEPTGTISWLANGNGICGVRYFYLRVRDNACPVKGKNVYVVGVRVSNSGTATGISKAAGNNLHFTAFPNPFSDRVSFRLDGGANAGNAQILIYNALGQEIDRFNVPAGTSETEWNNASRYPAGTYVARLLTENKASQTIKFIRIR